MRGLFVGSLCALFLAGGFLALLLLLTGGCQRHNSTLADNAPLGSPWFEDVTEQVGLHFVHDAGPVGQYFFPQQLGGGAALFDFDNDGRLDLYLVQNGGPSSPSRNRLYRQGSDGRFIDVSAGSGLDVSGYGMGVAIGDVNNDGWPDVFVTEYGRVRLFLNNGDGKSFTDITQEAELDNAGWATAAAFVDYDRDGWLDLVVVNYVDYDPSKTCTGPEGKQDFCGPQVFTGTAPRLYRNLGRQSSARTPHGVRFEDRTVRSGVGLLPGRGLGVVCADFNADHWPDIFIANDAEPNRLWINQKDGTFKEEALQRGIALDSMGRPLGNMGIALGDVDGDGLFDVFVAHLTEETHTLWKQVAPGNFEDNTVRSGLSASCYRGTGFGTVLADFDLDGALDLAVVDGRVRRGSGANVPGLDPFWRPYVERNQLFANDGFGFFRDVTSDNPAFCATPAVGRGLAHGDIFNKCVQDLVVTAVAGPARVFRNIAPRRGHSLVVRAIDPTLKRDAYGAEITVLAGKRQWLRWINPGSSFLCSNDPRAHFGLGAVESLDAIKVVWPDGTTETFAGGPVDVQLDLIKGQGPRWRGASR